jgi:general secretion pathway protein D
VLRSRAWFCACIAIFLPLAAAAQELVLDFRATPLPQIVDTIARQTGQRFLYDESLRGNVTISVPQRVSGQEALAVLDAALLLHGFAAVPGPGGVRRIARIETAASGSPWLAQEPRSGSEAPVTTLIRLEASSLSEVGQALRQLAGKSAVLSEYAPTQSILIAAPENQVKRLLQLARALDQASDRELRVLQLRYRDVASIEPLLEAALADERGLGGEVRVVGDERTGSLVVDARSEDHARVLALLRMLDLPIPGKKNLHVVRVLNVDAEQLAENLDALLQGGDLDAQNLDQPIRVVVDPPTHSLVIQAPPERFAAIAKVIAELDVPPERVSIEVTVVEASLDGDLSIGFDSLLAIGGVPNDQAELEEEGVVVIGTGEPDNLNPRPGSPPPSEYFVGRATGDPALLEVENPLGGGTIVVPVDFGGIIRAESGEANFHTVMQPHLLMTSGDEHQIVVGDNIPVPVSSAAAPVGEGGQVPVTSGLTTDVTFQRQDTGVDLRMTPKVLSREAVALELELSVSELAGVDPDRGPTITSRDLSASVRLRDGEVALIAALREPKRAQIRQAVPFLSRIPFLGNFFTVRREVERRRFLLISAQPMVLGTPADELARSIRLRVAFENQLARVKGLSELSPGPYALLVDTRDTPEAAEAVANELANPHWNVQVVPWSLEGQQHWDVYASGFQSLGAASAVSIELRDSGWQPRLTVLPERLE